MNEMQKDTALWLKDELEFINSKKAGYLNGELKPSLYSFDEANQEITISFPIADWEKNGLNTLHGGVSTTMMDLTMSMAIYCYSRTNIPPTISMSVNFIRPIPVSGDVLIKAKVTSIGRKQATAYCEAVSSTTGKVGCTSIGTYAIIRKED